MNDPTRRVRIAFALDAMITCQPLTVDAAEALLAEYGLTRDDILVCTPCECGGSPDCPYC